MFQRDHTPDWKTLTADFLSAWNGGDYYLKVVWLEVEAIEDALCTHNEPTPICQWAHKVVNTWHNGEFQDKDVQELVDAATELSL